MTNYREVDLSASFQSIVGDGYISHQPLSEIMPTRVGGVARHFIEAKEIREIVDSLNLAIENKVPYRVISAGTGTLVGESGFPGLIIKNLSNNIHSLESSSRATCDSGVDNARLVSVLASRGLGGVEFLSAIPGSIGAAVATNAKALGRPVVSYVRSLSVFDPDLKKVVVVDRDIAKPEFLAMFKQDLVFPPVILSVTLQMAALTQEEIIRRLGLVKTYLPVTTERVISHLFDEVIPPEVFDKDLISAFKQQKVTYDKKTGYLILKKDSQPQEVKTAIDMLVKKAREFGLEHQERLTYLGYFSEGPVV